MAGKENNQFDPGTGASFSSNTKRIINKDGTFNVRRIGGNFGLNDLYLAFVQMTWPKFLAILFLGFVLVNLAFASFYFLLGHGTLGETHYQNDSQYFLHCFFFSTQTFTTVGYGAISPTSASASLLASFEAFFGFLSFSLATGLLYGRFSRPNAKIKYSNQALLTKVNDKRALIFRLVNVRSNQLLDLRATVIITFTEHTLSHGTQRKYHRVKLQVSEIDFLPLSWTLVHFIDETSPLFNFTNQEILKKEGEILVHLKAFDETFSQEVHSRFSYLFSEINEGNGFERAYHTESDGTIVLDLEKLEKQKLD